MSIAKEIYGDDLFYKNGGFKTQGDYTPIVEHLGKVACRLDANDYQGDSYVFYKEENKYGVMIFGWGSCSGCDALQACDSVEELDSLIEQMTGDVRWFNTAKELYDWLNDDNYQQTQWHFHSKMFNNFKEKVNDMLVKDIVEEALVKSET